AFSLFPPLRRAVTPAALTLLSANLAFAATHSVDSLSALQAAINEAAAGDTIIVKNGAYHANAAISVSRTGSAAQPITISAESVGGVELAGAQGFNLA